MYKYIIYIYVYRVLPEDDTVVVVDADGAGVNDLIRQLVLEHAVLVDAGLVREGVGAHDRLVRLCYV